MSELTHRHVEVFRAVMTAGSREEGVDETLKAARRANVDYVLRKPFSRKQINNIIDTAERDLIDQTRADGRSLGDLAEESVDSYAALQRRRHRAEVRLRYYFGVSEVTR